MWGDYEAPADPELAQLPSSVTYFPDMGSFVSNESEKWHDRPASKWSIAKIGTLQARLECLKQSKKVYKFSSADNLFQITYNEIVQLSNDVFGFNGWCSEIEYVKVTSESTSEDGKHKLTMEAKVKVILKDGTYHDEVGSGQMTSAVKSINYGKCRKEAVTDAIKKAIYNLGVMLIDHENRNKNTFYH